MILNLCFSNCLWSPGGRLPPSLNPETYLKGEPRTLSWTAWKKAGHDLTSVVANPRITEGKKTWRVAANSPALKLGFKPWDWSGCGPRPRSRR